MLGLESLVSIIKSLVAWSEKAVLAEEAAKQVTQSSPLDDASDATASTPSPSTAASATVAASPNSALNAAAASTDDSSSSSSNVISEPPLPSRQTLHDNFERLRQRQRIVEKAILKFNEKPKAVRVFIQTFSHILTCVQFLLYFLTLHVWLEFHRFCTGYQVLG